MGLYFAAGMFAGALGLAAVLALLLDWDMYRHNKTLQAVMNMEIGEGVTLARGIDAYYGGKGQWRVPDKKGMVHVDAGMRGPRARLRVLPKTGELKIWDGNCWDDLPEREVLFGKLVKAAKERKADEERDGPDPVRRDLAYRLLNGFLEAEGSERTGDEMKIMFLTDQIYQRRLNLCERANLNFEDEDLEAIVSTYEQMNRLCAELMYNYGWHAGNRTYEVYAL